MLDAKRVGKITFDVPQVRESGFYPQALEKGLRSDTGLEVGASRDVRAGSIHRKVAAITEQLCGTEISSSQVSRATAKLDEQLAVWRERPLDQRMLRYHKVALSSEALYRRANRHCRQ